MASVMPLSAVAPRASLRSKVAVRGGAHVSGVQRASPRPAAARVVAASAVQAQDDLQLGQVGWANSREKNRNPSHAVGKHYIRSWGQPGI